MSKRIKAPVRAHVAKTFAAGSTREQIRKDFMKALIEASRHGSRFDVYTRWLQWCQATDMLVLLQDEEARRSFVAERDEALRKAHQDHTTTFEEMRRLLDAFFAADEAAAEVGDNQFGCDLLGRVYMDAELGSKHTGQFFTPWSVASMLAAMSVGNARACVAERGYVSLHEPSCGSGVMMLAAAQMLRAQGIDPAMQAVMAVQDLDLDCCRMAWLQLARAGVAAVVLWGNSLTGEIRRKWGTPALALFCARHGTEPLENFRSNIGLANPPFGGRISRGRALGMTEA